jgi:hypothetical protein
VQVPATLGTGLAFSTIKGAEARRQGDTLVVTPNAAAWEVVWTG